MQKQLLANDIKSRITQLKKEASITSVDKQRTPQYFINVRTALHTCSYFTFTAHILSCTHGTRTQ